MRKKNQVIYILLTGIALVSIFILYKNHLPPFQNLKSDSSQNQTKQDDSATFYFLPEKISASVGKDFTLDVVIEPKNHNVSNADLIFSYDKTKIRLDSISPSDQFSQILSSSISNEGIAIYAASTDFGSNISSKATYATLHFHALEEAKDIPIAIDFKKSGIYADDNPGTNILKSSDPASISITD